MDILDRINSTLGESVKTEIEESDDTLDMPVEEQVRQFLRRKISRSKRLSAMLGESGQLEEQDENEFAALVEQDYDDNDKMLSMLGYEVVVESGGEPDFQTEDLDELGIDLDRVLIEFPNGYFWYEVSDDEMREEGRRMGHAGVKIKRGDVIYSLRSPANNPRVTLEYDPRENEIVEMVGKGNSEPASKYMPYIKKFASEMGTYA